MQDIYVIKGGGQRVARNVESGIEVEYEVIKNSDYVEKSKASGVDSFTGQMWSADLETLQSWANQWAGEEVELILKDSEDNNSRNYNTIKDLIEASSKADIARARGKSQVHSTTQYPSFISKIEDVENAVNNLGYDIVLVKKR
ncbi:hypothetical protein [Maribacter sp.]|uniref:hypothetical protein n=1 Tax=Maribacter sp. TaxID=1897614 RepID=UPI0025BE2BBE|nr:hypothetical protein [Maribacter sp.]